MNGAGFLRLLNEVKGGIFSALEKKLFDQLFISIYFNRTSLISTKSKEPTLVKAVTRCQARVYKQRNPTGAPARPRC